MRIVISSGKVTTQFWPELIVLAVRALALAGTVVVGAKEIKEDWRSLKGQKK